MILDSMSVSQMKGASKMLYESEYYSHSWVIENIKLDLYMEAPELQLHESKEFEKPYHAHTYMNFYFLLEMIALILCMRKSGCL